MNKKLQRLKELFMEIKSILIKEKELNWVRGIDLILKEINSPEIGSSLKLKKISRSFKSMYAGNGSFSDVMIWRDDFEERRKANQSFEAVLNKIWEILSL